jgi:hypothetical protein
MLKFNKSLCKIVFIGLSQPLVVALELSPKDLWSNVQKNFLFTLKDLDYG